MVTMVHPVALQDYANKFVLLDARKLTNCTAEEAILMLGQANATGVVVMAAENEPLVEIGWLVGWLVGGSCSN